MSMYRYGMMGGKVTRHIVFPEVLDVKPYVSRVSSENSADEHRYRLYGVLVHEGHSTSSGHYYCYVMTADGSWYCMNDHIVSCFFCLPQIRWFSSDIAHSINLLTFVFHYLHNSNNNNIFIVNKYTYL